MTTKERVHGTTRYEFMARVVELSAEYADEAEHQDGEEYWNEFESSDEAAIDFATYVKDALT